MGTYLERSIDNTRVDLLPNLSLYILETVQRVQAFTQGFIARGFPASQAQQQAYAALEGVLMKQVFLITCSPAFLILDFFWLAARLSAQ